MNRRLPIATVAVFVCGVVVGIAIARFDREPAARATENKAPADPKLEKGLAKVLTVQHGDELTVLWRPPMPLKFSVRLNRVDTPFKDRPGGNEALNALADLAYGKYIRIEFEDNAKPYQDRSNRLIAYLRNEDGENLNVEMVRRGAAPFFTQYGEGKHAAQFKAAEAEARAARRGVWAKAEE